MTCKWVEVNHLSNGQYSVNKNIRLKNPMLISDLCDNSDSYIVVKRIITVADANNAKKTNKKLAFKNNASFR